jgi:filamentous hemagglutinin family protein
MPDSPISDCWAARLIGGSTGPKQGDIALFFGCNGKLGAGLTGDRRMRSQGWLALMVGIVGWGAIATPFTLSNPGLAQSVLPDATLGAETSTVTPDMVIRGVLSDLIEGGATRGSNLFHSFERFTIDAGRGVYFANPAGIENILSRVTGNSRSDIFGRLGVLGNANLFLLNPNGIVFGPNADLDITGSFTATTANAIQLGDRGFFSATQPQQSSLLAVAPGALLYNQIVAQGGRLVNTGNLAAGQDLTLAANNLELQGQLRSGRDLTLEAQDTVRIRDSVTAPFVAGAGRNLLVQGNQAVDIFALNHPSSGLGSRGNMVLRSASPVGGDAHYWSGGSFRVENLDTSLGELFSPIDPVIRALGDVAIFGYQGGSLHILAGGSVNIGTAIITSADPGEIGVDFLRETITLSDGTVVAIDGGAQPTLDVRAGVAPAAIGSIPLENPSGVNPFTDFFVNDQLQPSAPGIGAIPSRADITVGDVWMTAPNGLVLLTTQYQPNADLAGGNIFVTGEGLRGVGIDARGFGGNGADVYLNAQGSISLNGRSRIDTTSNLGRSGNINLVASEGILLQGERSSSSRPSIRSNMTGLGQGGNITLQADSISLRNAFIDASSFGQGNAGRISIEANRFFTLEDGSDIFNDVANGSSNSNEQSNSGGIFITAASLNLRDSSNIFNLVENSRIGFGGGIKIEVNSLDMSNSSQINAGVLGEGRSGNILIYAENISLRGTIDPLNSGAFTSINNTLGSILEPGNSQGAAGNIHIESSQISLIGSQITSSSFGQGNAGNITLIANDRISLSEETVISSSISSGGIGRGGDITVNSGSFFMEDGAEILSIIRGIRSIETPAGIVLLPPGQGTAGNIYINSQGLISITGIGPLVNDGPFSGISASVDSGATGIGGSVEVRTTGDFFASNGANLRSTLDEGATGSAGRIIVNALNIILDKGAAFESFSAGDGKAGDISVSFVNNLIMESNAAIRSNNVISSYDGGDIMLRGGSSIIISDSSISAQSSGQGKSGNIDVEIDNEIQALNATISTNSELSTGGIIRINSPQIVLRGNSDFLTFVNRGDGDGGKITITGNFIIALDDSDILAFSADGQGGDIDLSRTIFFGQNANIGSGKLTREELLALNGNDRVDVNASGGVKPGQITVGDSSFIQNSLTQLSQTAIDTNQLLATSCIVRRNQPTANSFFITGPGGLPDRPGTPSSPAFPTGEIRNIATDPNPQSAAPRPWQIGDPIQEPDGVYQLPNGELILSHQCR